MLENTGVYICTICGFVYIGDTPQNFAQFVRCQTGSLKKLKGVILMAKKFAVRNLRLCTKDCLCLHVCPTGATDTENSIIDIDKCTGCGDCADACPSGAISMVPVEIHLNSLKPKKLLAK